MGDMHFTEWGTVVLGKKEISVKKFFSKLDRLIETKGYGVEYNKKWDEFNIKYNYKKYKLQLSEEEIKNPKANSNIMHLFYLSRIEEKAEIERESNEALSNPLDRETKKFYLDILKKRKASLHIYGKNLLEDFQIMKGHSSRESILNGTLIGGTVAAVAFMLMLTPIVKSLMVFTIMPLGLGCAALECLAFYVVNRINRLAKFFYAKRLRRIKIKTLEKELSINNTLCIEDKQIEEKEEELEIKNSIPSMINALIESLEEVSVANRGTLREEIKQLLVDYMGRIDDATKSDIEICTEYPDTLKRINELERRIKIAKKLDTSRKKESKYLLEKLEKMESSQEVMEKPKVKELRL